jgi:DNA-binding transcriptional ArsR family regulator
MRMTFPSTTDINMASSLLTAMGNRKRMIILDIVSRNETSVGKLAVMVGVGQSALSQHLAMTLEGSGRHCWRQAIVVRRILGPAEALRWSKTITAWSDRVHLRMVELCRHCGLNGLDVEISGPDFSDICG